MYSSEYEDEQISNNSSSSSINSFYQNNKKLVWIFIAIVLVVIIVVILKNKTGSSTVNPVNNVSVMVYPETDISISPGNTYKLIAVVNNNPNATITWTSSDENILKVDGGVVTGIDYGKATITASYLHSDNNKYEYLKEIVVAEGKSNISITDVSIKEGDLVMPIGGTYTIGLNVVPTNGYITSKVFKSSNESVATVDNKGNVKAVGEGEAAITININNSAFTKELKVFVNKDYTNSEIIASPTKITLNKESTKIKVGGTVKLSYTVVPSEARGSNLIWTSSDASVLTVDKSGIITALKEGKATIKLASLNGVNDTLDIEVIKDSVLVTDISLSLSNVYLETGQSQTITPEVIPDTATDKTLSYTSSDENVMTVTATNEGTSCSVTGVSAGTATLTIKANDGEVTKEVSVIVGDSSSSDSGSYDSGGGGGGGCAKTCPAGQYVNNCKCVTCEANNYCKGGKKTACPSGYKSSAGASACTRSSCPSGTYLDSSYSTGCRPCPSGKVCSGGTAMPKSCANGEIPNAGKTACTKCSGIANCTAYGGGGTSCKCTSCQANYVNEGTKCRYVGSTTTKSCASRSTVGECNASSSCKWDYTYGCRNK